SKKKITPEVTFDLDEDEYPSIKEQIALRGWRRLASPRTKVTKWMMHEFYANAVQSDEEMGQDYTTRLNSDQRLDEVLQDLCIPGATWRLSSGQPAQAIHLRRAELNPLARGRHEFFIHSIMPTGNKSEITIERAILIHSIIKGEDVRVEEIIVDNIAMIAQGMQGKSNLAFPNLFSSCARMLGYLCENLGEKHNKEGEEDQPMPQYEGGNEEEQNQGQHQHFQPQYHQDAGFQQHYMEQQQQGFTLLNEQFASMQDELWNNTNRFHHQIRKEQDMLAREIQEVKKYEVNQTLMGNQKGSMEKLEQSMVSQQQEMTEMKRQLKDWTRNASTRDANCCWAHQQANPNLIELPVHQLPELMHLNAEKGRHLFYGGLKSHLVAGSSSQAALP
ncbi:hypothetical protein PIB30_077165, partial [Stylosanthes scabra]|nr:hypothetical protein [Stylosanthes scabra]